MGVRLVWPKMAKPRSSVHSSIFGDMQICIDLHTKYGNLYRKGLSHLINVGVGTGKSEVIGIGVGEKVVGFGECGDKELE